MSTDHLRSPTSRRSPVMAVVLSGLFPGLGQLYNRARLKAALFFIAGVVTAYWPAGALDTDIDLSDPAPAIRKMLVATLPFLVVALWSVVDAYRSAKRPGG